MSREDWAWLIIPAQPNTREEADALRDWEIAFKNCCRSRSIKPAVYRARLVTVACGTKYWLMSPEDAQFLYKEIHRSRISVICYPSVAVSVEPEARIPHDRNVIRLRRYCRYKAPVETLDLTTNDHEATIRRKLEMCIEWHTNRRCEGERDPRVLPLHVFLPRRDDLDLNDPDSRVSFEREHGNPRVDRNGGIWKVGDPPHGRDISFIAGTEIRPGYHWDVQAEQGSLKLRSAAEVWQLPRRSYLNIYPNAHMRHARRRSRAKRIYPERD